MGLVLVNGNSHPTGRVFAVAGVDVFADGVTQWTQAGAEEPIQAAILDTGDDSGNYDSRALSPMLTFANALMATGNYDRVCFVSDTRGASGLSQDLWSTDTAHWPNRLSGTVDRWSAAKAAIEAGGDVVVPICAIWMNSNPDGAIVGASEPSLAELRHYTDLQDGYVNFIRGALDGVGADFPVIVSNAMTQHQIDRYDADEQIRYAAASAMGNSAKHRIANTYNIDVIHDQGDGEASNLPVVPFDNIHADRDGELTKGRLLFSALPKAIANSDPRAPFSGLSSYDSMTALRDYRSGSLVNWITGEDSDVYFVDNKAPLLRHDTTFGSTAHTRMDEDGGARTVNWSGGLTPQYTLSMRCWTANDETFPFIMNAHVDFRFFRSGSSGDIICGHSEAPEIRVPGGLVSGQVYQITLTYDGSTMRVYRDDTELAAAAAPAPPSGNLSVGNQTLDHFRPFEGAIQSWFCCNQALSPGQIAELVSAY